MEPAQITAAMAPAPASFRAEGEHASPPEDGSSFRHEMDRVLSGMPSHARPEKPETSERTGVGHRCQESAERSKNRSANGAREVRKSDNEGAHEDGSEDRGGGPATGADAEPGARAQRADRDRRPQPVEGSEAKKAEAATEVDPKKPTVHGHDTAPEQPGAAEGQRTEAPAPEWAPGQRDDEDGVAALTEQAQPAHRSLPAGGRRFARNEGEAHDAASTKPRAGEREPTQAASAALKPQAKPAAPAPKSVLGATERGAPKPHPQSQAPQARSSAANTAEGAQVAHQRFGPRGGSPDEREPQEGEPAPRRTDQGASRGRMQDAQRESAQSGNALRERLGEAGAFARKLAAKSGERAGAEGVSARAGRPVVPGANANKAAVNEPGGRAPGVGVTQGWERYEMQVGRTFARRLQTATGRTVEQVRTAVVRQAEYIHGNGRSEVRLQLQPPELGRIRVEVEMRDGRLEVRLRVENPDVRQAMQRELQGLDRAFRDAQVDVNRFELTDYSSGRRWAQAGSEGRAQTGSIRSGEGVAPAMEAADTERGWARIGTAGSVDCLV